MKKRVFISIILTILAITATCIEWHHCPAMILISVGILTFLLGYKITDYLAEFKTTGKHSRIDIVFLVVFFVLLFIPMSYIDNRDKSILENRFFASKPMLLIDKKPNLNFGKDFNNWFNDRFATRKILINSNSAIKCILNHQSCQNGDVVYNKEYNFLYRNYNFWGMEPITGNKQEILETYAININNLKKYCDSKNIRLYILIVPRQADYLEYKINDVRLESSNPSDEVIDYWKKNTDVKIIYPTDEMKLVNKTTPVFFKTDHHWTKKGAYVGYANLMKEVKKDFPDVQILDDNKLEHYYDNRVSEWWDKKLNTGQTYRHMGLPKWYAKKVLNTPYLYYKNPDKEKLQVISDSKYKKYGRDAEFFYPKGTDKKLMIVGDSFGCNFLEFAPYSFRHTLYLYNNPRGLTFENYQSIIESYKPDALLLLFYTPNIPKFLDLYPNPYRKIEVTE